MYCADAAFHVKALTDALASEQEVIADFMVSTFLVLVCDLRSPCFVAEVSYTPTGFRLDL